jgi:Tfp pilus assembly protein PilN
MIEDLYAAADEAGWTIAAVVSGYNAVAVGCAGADGDATSGFIVPIRYDGRAEALHVARGRACCVRRYRDPTEAAAADLVPACGAADVPVADPAGESSSASFAQTAARHAGDVQGPELIPRGRRHARIRSGRRLGVALLSAAAGVLLVAAWAEHRGVGRELALVQAARSAVAPRVEAALATRDQLATLDRGLVLLSSLHASAPDWGAVVGDLAERLPPDASIMWMHGLADSLRIEGTARDASSVLESLRQSQVLSRVRAEAPFERETTERGDVERFRLAAEILPRLAEP